MRTWFLALTQRERTMVQVAASVILLFIIYFLVIEPISSRYNKNKKNVATSIETIEWMRSAAQEVNQLRGGKLSIERPQGKQFVLSLIDQSARKAGLAAVMKRVQPEGESGVRIWFENAAFDELLKWLATVESKQGLIVNEINIEQTESSGLVNVRVFLEP